VTREEDLLYDICNALENAGENLEKEPAKTIVLRLAQERVQELSAETRNEDLVLLNYFLKSFIERLWDNLMIDFPYEKGEETNRIRREILDQLIREIGSTLKRLADSIRRGDPASCYKAYQKLANSYIQRTRELEGERR
jgi:hypothetical protein